MRRIKICGAIVIFLVVGAPAAHAQAIFRGFIGPTQATCEDFDYQPSSQKMLVAGGTIGWHGGAHVDANIGAITNLCQFKPDRVLVSGGMHLYPAVLLHQKLSIGVAINADWDIPEMQRSFRGEDSGDAFLFLRPELAVRVIWPVGEIRVNDDGERYSAGAFGFDVHVGRYRYSGNYVTVGMTFAIN